MRRVIWSVMTSLDGRSAAAGEGFATIDWFRADEEWLDYSVELLDQTDTLLFGGITFAGMEQYWPTAEGPVAERMNGRSKVGFSRTPRRTAWSNARMEPDPVTVVSELRAEDGRDAVLLGSANLAGTLVARGLVDEYRFAVNPVLLGGGVPVVLPGSDRVELDLADVRRFGSGIVEMRCTPRADPPAARYV
jgi:dihydrofolate reductase